MKFIDEIEILVKSGNGGKGRVSFLHNYANPMAGPDGGNGGKGGDLFFMGSNQINSFYKLTSRNRWFAKSGMNGGDVLKTGKSGDDLYIEVPLGTIIYIINEKNKKEFFGEMLLNDQSLIFAKGGKGGLGNSAFSSSINRAPRYAQNGELTKEFKVYLELKTIADIGFIGLPNSGKSTLLNSLTNADVKAENFEFTTLNPQLGVLNESKSKIKTVIADLPGIIKGASENKGLGLRFLRHISRCKVLVYIIDSNREDPISDFYLLEDELKNSNLSDEFKTKEKLIVWNKIDLLSIRELNMLKAKSLTLYCKTSVFISALEKKNLDEVTELIENIVEKTKDLNVLSNVQKTYKVYDFTSDLDIQVIKLKNSYWKVFGSYLEKIITENRKNKIEIIISKALENPIAKKKLINAGVKAGDILLINNNEYFWT
jgi:GTPase